MRRTGIGEDWMDDISSERFKLGEEYKFSNECGSS